MTDGRDDVTDRVASRLDRDESESAGEDGPPAANEQSTTDTTNVKEAWSAKTIYLPDDLDSRLSREYKRLDFDLDEDLDTLRKTRHFYPLVVSLGLEALERTEREELIERIEEIDPD